MKRIDFMKPKTTEVIEREVIERERRERLEGVVEIWGKLGVKIINEEENEAL